MTKARTLAGVVSEGSPLADGTISAADVDGLSTTLSSYIPLTGGTMTGPISFAGTQTWPTFNQNTTGTASNVTGTVALANGGTGATTAANARTNLGLAIGSNVQAWDADLDAIAALAGTSGFLKKTAANTWSLDTNTYLTGNQTITVSGDATGSGATSVALTLANSGVTTGTYTKVTVDAKGRVTTGASLASADLPTYTGTITSSQVTTALGFTPYNSTNPSGYITSSALSSYLPLSGGTLTGAITSSFASAAINTTTPGLTNYGFVFNGASSTDNAQAITWASGGGAQAGIYVQSSGSYGTKMYLATTDSFATGARTAVSIDHTGAVNIVRGALTQGGNQVLHAGNYTSYSPSLTGSGASGTWGITTTADWLHSDRDFASGTLITTNINYAVTYGDPFVLEIRGNSYGDAVPYDIQYQGYIYSDTIINHGGYSNGTYISGLVALNVGGNLCFWFPHQSYWNGFNVRAYIPYAGRQSNRVTSITSTAKPSGTKEVALSANIRQSLHSGNYTSYAVGVTNNSTLNSDTRNTRGVTRLYRRDDNSDYSVQTYWTGSYWRLYGYNGDSAHADTQVGLADRATRANGNFYIDDNYGCGIVGVYTSTRYQGVFAMGDSYKLPADGTTTGSLYGMAWSHPNAGGVAGNLDSHGMIVMINGGFGSCMSFSIKASGNVTAYSDERLKTNWRSMPTNYVARLAQVKVGIYDRTDNERLTQVGVSAQSFQELLPQAITVANDEIGTLSVSYGNAALASAVELAKDNVELRARIERLEALVEQLLNKE